MGTRQSEVYWVLYIHESWYHIVGWTILTPRVETAAYRPYRREAPFGTRLE